MFEVGQVFKKHDCDFCVLDVLYLNSTQYLLMSVEHEKLEYLFYEVYPKENGYGLRKVIDDSINYALFELVEMNNKKE